MIHWTRFLCLKGLRLITLLIAVSVCAFWLVSLSPVDPIQAYIGADMLRVSPEQREAISTYWGLDLPPTQRFARWANALFHGDLGTSMIYREPVVKVMSEKFVNSVTLMGSSWLLSGVIGFGAGAVAAMRKGTWLDRAITWYCYTLAATPAFWLGLLLLIVFSVWLGWLPIGLSVPVGMLAEQVTLSDKFRHMVLPMVTLSVVGIAPIALHTRQKLIDVLKSDYVLFAKARGEKGFRLFYRHGLRNIALPAISLQLASFSELFGGSILVEQVFSYPGLGQATVEAGVRGDIPLLLGLVLFSALFVFLGNALADMLYQWVDPRLRGGRTP